MSQQIGAIHYNFPNFSFEQFAEFIGKQGGNRVEVAIRDVWNEAEQGALDESTFAAASAQAEKLRDVLAANGVQASALSAVNDFVQTDPAVVKSQVSRMELVARLAKIFGPHTVLRSEGGQPKDIPQEKWLYGMYECFMGCTDFCEKLEIDLAIDNHGVVSNDADLLYNLLQKVNHPRIGTNLDTMNYRWYGYSVDECKEIYKKMAPYAKHTHIKDGFDSRGDYKGAALGEGEIDLPFALQCLRDANYNGAYLAEYEGKELEDGVGYAKCIAWLKQNV
jgi:sugar phosphate isomerase/epimerase